MAGGSKERESPEDRQCGCCGRFFNFRGIAEHEESCPHPEWAQPLVPLEDDDGSAPIEADSVDVEQRSDAIASDVTEEAVTDGGNPAFGGPEATTPADPPADPDDEDVDDTEEVTECPCGEEFDESDAQLRERFGSGPTRLRHDCGRVLRVVL